MSNRYLLAILVFFLSGCTAAIVKMQMSSETEVLAYKNADWVVIAKTADGKPVQFDPYQVKFSNAYTFTLPLSVPMANSEVYGNYVYLVNCNNENAIAISTLGGRPLNSSVTFSPNTVGGVARLKLCGRRIDERDYQFLSMGSDGNEFYYSRTLIKQHYKNASIYEVGIASVDSVAKYQLYKIEVDCSTRKYKLSGQDRWVEGSKRSPLDILGLRICRTPEIKPYALAKYGDTPNTPSQNNISSPTLMIGDNLQKPSVQVNENSEQKCRKLGLKPGMEDYQLCIKTLNK